jgi:Zn-dependent alcohol dehydrogenase
VVEPADTRKGHDPATARRLDRAPHGRIAIERHVRPVLVVVGGVPPNQTEEVALTEHDHVVEQLAAQNADEGLGVPVRGVARALPFRSRGNRGLSWLSRINEAFDLMHEGKSIRTVVE